MVIDMQIIENLTSYINSFLEPFSKYEVFGNNGADYITALVVFIISTVVFAVIQRVLISRLQSLAGKTSTDLDDTFIAIVRGVRPAFYTFASVYLSLRILTLPDIVITGLTIILVIWIAIQVVFALQKLIDYSIKKREKIEDDESASAAYSYLGNIAKALLWLFAALAVLANFGINITSVLAGLGIAGIAVGFALQNILGDLFSSFAIYFDKPFVIGDVITIGEHTGTVEHIGIKTTRIRALQGEEIVISNQELTSAKVQNFRKLEERRVTFTVGVLYETPSPKLKKIPEIIESIIKKTDMVREDRVNFKELGDYALVFEVVYYVLSSAYSDKMRIQESINYEIFDAFENEGIGFAYPTQTLYLTK
jgi:small-conductance mechanosensitive channel